MNSVIATEKSAFISRKHILLHRDVRSMPAREPLKIVEPQRAHSSCQDRDRSRAAPRSDGQRMPRAVTSSGGQSRFPILLFARAPAGTSGIGRRGYDPDRDRSYIMYLFHGGPVTAASRWYDSDDHATDECRLPDGHLVQDAVPPVLFSFPNRAFHPLCLL